MEHGKVEFISIPENIKVRYWIEMPVVEMHIYCAQLELSCEIVGFLYCTEICGFPIKSKN